MQFTVILGGGAMAPLAPPPLNPPMAGPRKLSRSTDRVCEFRLVQGSNVELNIQRLARVKRNKGFSIILMP
jgi:hypothetical protein